MSPLICPSILAADFANMGEAVRQISAVGADMIHVDVMDGHFVPEITFGPQMVAAIAPYTDLPLDVHLMIDPVDAQIPKFAKAGAHYISFHPEASQNVGASIEIIKQNGAKAGLVLNPNTDLSILDAHLDTLDLILVMTIYPGYGGQAFMPEVLPRIAIVAEKIAQSQRDIILQIDGGINPQTAAQCLKQGASALVAGTYIFRQPPADWGSAISALRTACAP